MDVDFNPPSVPTAASTSTMINISQWDIDGDRIHGKSSLASIEDPTAESAPLASNSTAHDQATFDYNFEVEPTFYDADEDINLKEEPSAKRSFVGVS